MFIAALFINYQNMEATQVTISRWKDKEEGMLFIHKTAICNKMDRPGGYYISELSQTEKGKHCSISFVHGILKIWQTSQYNKKVADS